MESVSSTAAVLAAPKKRPAKVALTQEGIVFALAVAIFLAFSVLLRGFLTPGNVIALVRSVSILGILGLGMSVVVIGRGIDIAMVAVMVISVASALAIAQHGIPLPFALLIGLVLALFVGLAIGIFTAYAEIPAIFTTLAMGSVVYGLGRSLFLSLETQNAPGGEAWFQFLGRGSVLGLPTPIIVFGALAALLYGVLRFTRLGRYIYAIGDNPQAARISGVPTRPVMLAQYCASALIAYIAGIVMAASVGGMNTRVYNSTMIYDVLLVVVLGGIGLSGGRGGVRNVLVGTILVGILLNGMTILDVTYTIQNLVKSLILLAALVLDTFVNPRDEQTAQQGDI